MGWFEMLVLRAKITRHAYRAINPAVAPARTTCVLEPTSLRWRSALLDMHLNSPFTGMFADESRYCESWRLFWLNLEM
jgi:hypothetical protein